MTYTKTRVLLEPGVLYQGFMPVSILKPDENSDTSFKQKSIPDQVPFMVLGEENPPRFPVIGVVDGTWILHEGQKWWLKEDQYGFLELAE